VCRGAVAGRERCGCAAAARGGVVARAQKAVAAGARLRRSRSRRKVAEVECP
jgi:hypothetical protein